MVTRVWSLASKKKVLFHHPWLRAGRPVRPRSLRLSSAASTRTLSALSALYACSVPSFRLATLPAMRSPLFRLLAFIPALQCTVFFLTASTSSQSTTRALNLIRRSDSSRFMVRRHLQPSRVARMPFFAPQAVFAQRASRRNVVRRNRHWGAWKKVR